MITDAALNRKNGHCRFGDRCNFAHGEAHLRRAPGQASSSPVAEPSRSYAGVEQLTTPHRVSSCLLAYSRIRNLPYHGKSGVPVFTSLAVLASEKTGPTRDAIACQISSCTMSKSLMCVYI